MKLATVLLVSLTVLVGESSPAAIPNPSSTLQTALAARPLHFTQNLGQWPDSILFRTDAGGAVVWITASGAYYQLTRQVPEESIIDPSRPATFPERPGHSPGTTEILLIKVSFLGSNPNVTAVGEQPLEYKCNYFLGNDPDRWRTDVPNYQAVTLRNVYDGVDLQFFTSPEGGLAYQYDLAPGADVGRIQLAYEGLENVSRDATGRLTGQTPWGEISGVLAGPGTTGSIRAGATDWSPAVPSLSAAYPAYLIHSRYLGGGGSDWGRDIVLDQDGNIYVIGTTASADFPATAGAYQTTHGGGIRDVFVTKLYPAQVNPIYSTYLGGNGSDEGYSIAYFDGSVYLTGQTASTNFPTAAPLQPNLNGTLDAYVARLSPSGSSLSYSTYLGGSDQDGGIDIAVDNIWQAYVTGWTKSIDFPAGNSYGGNQDAFVTTLSLGGNYTVYSSYLGGDSIDVGYGVAVDDSYNAWITGCTYSPNFPTHNPYQAALGGVVMPSSPSCPVPAPISSARSLAATALIVARTSP